MVHFGRSIGDVLWVRCGRRKGVCHGLDAVKSLHRGAVCRDVGDGMPISDRVDIGGETLVMADSRDESQACRCGCVQMWQLESTTGRYANLYARR